MADVSNIRQWELLQRGEPFILTAERIGHASSRRSHHNHPLDAPNDPADKTKKSCTACYWTEVQIFRTAPPARAKYVVYTEGATSVPGAATFSRITYTDAHHEVIEILVDRSNGRPPVMTATTARALSQAASKDPDMDYAWINRALP